MLESSQRALSGAINKSSIFALLLAVSGTQAQLKCHMNTVRVLSGDILYICFMVPQALQLRYKHKYSPNQHCMLSDQSPGLPLCSDTGHIQASSIIFLQMYLGPKPTATVASGGQKQCSIFFIQLQYLGKFFKYLNIFNLRNFYFTAFQSIISYFLLHYIS